MLHGIVGGGEAGHGRSSRVADNEVGYGLGPVKTSVAPCNTWPGTSVTGFLSHAPQHMQTHSHGRDVQRSARPSVRRAGCRAWRRRCLRWWEASLLRGAGCALVGGRASRSRRCPAVAVAVAASRVGEGEGEKGEGDWEGQHSMPGASRRVHRVGGEMTRGQGRGPPPGRGPGWHGGRVNINNRRSDLCHSTISVPPMSPAALVPICTPLHPIWAFDVLAAHLRHEVPADPPFHNPHDS